MSFMCTSRMPRRRTSSLQDCGDLRGPDNPGHHTRVEGSLLSRSRANGHRACEMHRENGNRRRRRRGPGEVGL